MDSENAELVVVIECYYSHGWNLVTFWGSLRFLLCKHTRLQMFGDEDAFNSC